MNEDGTMARLPQLGEIAAKFGLKIVSIKDIQEYRKNITSKSNKYGTQSKKSKDIASDSEDGHAKVQDLSKIFNVTDVTIRQDLKP